MPAGFWTIYMGIYGGGVVENYVPTVFVQVNRYNAGCPDFQLNRYNSGCPDVRVMQPTPR